MSDNSGAAVFERALEMPQGMTRTSKTCNTCHVEKPIGEFSKIGGQASRWRASCKLCRNTQEAARRQALAEANQVADGVAWGNVDLSPTGVEPSLDLSPLDAAYLAGFLDGEGSFAIRASSGKRDRHVRGSSIVVSVSQAEPRTGILYWLQQVYGGTVVTHGRARPNHNEAKNWSITGKAAARLCRSIIPFLRLKKRHAELLLEHQATKLSEHIGTRKGTPRAAFRIPEAIIELRNRQYVEIRRLNQRGLQQGSQ